VTSTSRVYEANLLRSVIATLRHYARPFLSFGILFTLFVLWFAGPAVAWLIRQLYRTSGDSAVSNADILSFFFTPLGMAVVVLAGVAMLAEVSARRAGFVVIAAGAVGSEAGAGLFALRAILKRLPCLAAGVSMQTGLALLAASPLGGLGYLAYRQWMSSYDISYFLHARPPGYAEMQITAIVLTVLLCALLVSLYLRWVFVIPLCVLTSCGPRAALRLSATMGRGFHRYLLRALAIAAAILWITSLVLKWTAEHGVDLLLSLFPDDLGVSTWLAAALIVMAVVATVVVSLSMLAAEASLIARLYQRRRPEAEPPADLRRQPVRLTWWSLRSGKVRRRWAWTVTLIITMSSLTVIWLGVHRTDLHTRPQVMAHRGASKIAPENTLSALRRAVEAGADWVEIDVQLTADSQVVLFHDGDLMRTSGDSARIADLSIEQLARFDVGSWFAPEFADERIPSLAEAIDAVRGRAGLNIELKYVDPGSVLIERVVRTVQETGFADHCLVTSFTYGELQAVRHIDSSIRTGLIIAASLGNVSNLNLSALNIEHYNISRRHVRDAHARKLEVISGTVDDPRQMEALIHLGVDYIMTNRPDVLVDLLAERDELTAIQLLTLNLRSLLSNR